MDLRRLAIVFSDAAVYFDNLSRGKRDDKFLGNGLRYALEVMDESAERISIGENGNYRDDPIATHTFGNALEKYFGHKIKHVDEVRAGLEMLAKDFRNADNLSGEDLSELAKFSVRATESANRSISLYALPLRRRFAA